MTATADTGQDWQAAWQPVIDAIGKDFAEGAVTWGGDAVERGGIRRYLEPLELDCALHTDPELARAAGYADVTMPATGVIAWTIPAAWTPGQVLFASSERDAQPVHSAINNADMTLGPRTTGFFGTDIEVDFLRDVVAGERLGRRGRTLLSCKPKETAVGRGAFLTWGSEIVTAELEVVGRIRIGTYAYVPHAKEEDAS
ncbi:MaoC family dehydratase N-terminal domain-containing protein [Nocardioides carbamazepini]|uniref:MaoC family dehydratase N-terminal domain-containing protein n=1 Tax=Nocardioides TaxID=1839 RepID=UPI002149E710|nr:MaoC family dehydratase N-terminal domain-containing protein [Nocardioides carbamazepini]MCR1786275.1 MaoC family dehydratase N-terminal domain-containing protein [Nocardioides carbamazepini]MDQ6523415.1 MaoC family dehydratase N-terminal domain-containing protein [Nocardioides sp. LHD-245]